MIEITRKYIVVNNLHKILKCNAFSEITQNEVLLNSLSAQDLCTIFDSDIDTLKNCTKIKVEKLSEKLKKVQYKNFKFWIDKETRNSLFNLLVSLDENSDFDLIVETELITLPVFKVKKFLTALEQYASACKVQTLKHINNIKDIKNVEDLLKYDYTLGYPNQINLNDFI